MSFYEKIHITMISKEDIETFRTPEQFIEWVNDTLSQFDTRDKKILIRSKSKPEYKVFLEESYPLMLFCKRYFNNTTEEIQLKQILGNQTFDVMVENHIQFQYIEITQAINGEIEALRMEQLNSVGYVSASGPISVKGTKKQLERIVKFDEYDENMKVLIEKFPMELIEECVDKKIKKAYPLNTFLLIVFDDHRHIHLDDDLDYLNEFMKITIYPKISQVFRGASLIGLSGKTFFTI